MAAGILASAVGALLLLPAGVAAHSTGETGHSGRQGVICNQCHSGGTAPTVAFEGPTAVAPGDTATYRFVVQSARAGQRAAGFNVAASAGTLAVVDGQGEQRIGAELTHRAPQDNVDGVASWTFTWTAPAQPGEATLFGAGNSVNRNGANSGDRAAATTLAVMVVAPEPATPTPSATPLPSPTDTAPPTATRAPIDTRPPGPTPTPGGPCGGDCNGDRVVTVNELVLGVGIALGGVSADACAAIDGDGTGAVTISELVAAVASLLDGCP